MIREARCARLQIMKKNNQLNPKNNESPHNFFLTESQFVSDETSPTRTKHSTISDKQKLPQIHLYFELLKRVLML